MSAPCFVPGGSAPGRQRQHWQPRDGSESSVTLIWWTVWLKIAFSCLNRHLMPLQNLEKFKAFTWVWHSPSRSPHHSTTNRGHRRGGEKSHSLYRAGPLISCVEMWTPIQCPAVVCSLAKNTPVRAISLSITWAHPELWDQSSPQPLLQNATGLSKLRGMHKTQGLSFKAADTAGIHLGTPLGLHRLLSRQLLDYCSSCLVL